MSHPNVGFGFRRKIHGSVGERHPEKNTNDSFFCLKTEIKNRALFGKVNQSPSKRKGEVERPRPRSSSKVFIS